jgi:hypothetical protein
VVGARRGGYVARAGLGNEAAEAAEGRGHGVHEGGGATDDGASAEQLGAHLDEAAGGALEGAGEGRGGLVEREARARGQRGGGVRAQRGLLLGLLFCCQAGGAARRARFLMRSASSCAAASSSLLVLLSSFSLLSLWRRAALATIASAPSRFLVGCCWSAVGIISSREKVGFEMVLRPAALFL